MERHELFAGVNRVKAPAGFEAGVLAKLPAARKERARARRAMTYRYAFAGSAALVLAGFLFFNPSGVDKGTVLSYAEREALSATPETGAIERGCPPRPRFRDHGLRVGIPQRPPATPDGLHTGAGFRDRIFGNHLLGGSEAMNRMLKPALVIMASLAVLAPSFGAEAAGAKGIGGEPDIAGVAKKVYPSVVRVEGLNGTRRVATGVVVEKGGYIVTTALDVPARGKDHRHDLGRQEDRGRVPRLRHRDPAGPAQGQGRRTAGARHRQAVRPGAGLLGMRRGHLARRRPRP